MWEWLINNSSDIVIFITLLTFVISVAVLAFSAFRYVSIRREELRNERYEKYHKLMRDISKGYDTEGPMKLVSQRAFIYELRHFPEYKKLTVRLLEALLGEWREKPEVNAKLTLEIQDPISALEK